MLSGTWLLSSRGPDRAAGPLGGWPLVEWGYLAVGPVTTALAGTFSPLVNLFPETV
jgi:hypothetical protein